MAEEAVQDVAVSDLMDLPISLAMTLGDLEELADFLGLVAEKTLLDEPSIVKDIRAKFDNLLSEIEAGIAEATDAAVAAV